MERLVQELIRTCREKKLKVAVVESCTGGLVAKLITDIPGASDVFDRGFVTYSNAAKSEMLGVKPELIETHGAVSAEVACALAQGGLKSSRAQLVVALTGIAGPDGGSKDKPVGLVHIAVASTSAAKGVRNEECYFDGGRSAVRLFAAEKALLMLQEAAERL